MKKREFEKSKKDSVRSVERTLAILQTFTIEMQELSLAQICLQTALPKTTTYRILTTLVDCNVIMQDPLTGKYRLGYEMIKMGNIAQESNSLQRTARADMEELSHETQQTCNLYIRDGFERRCIAQVVGTEYVKRYSYLGARYPLYCGAGKLLLAYADKDVQEQYFSVTTFEQYTEHTMTDPDVLRKDLQQILQDGYSLTKGERDPTTAMISAPLYDYTGKVVASLTISGHIYLFTDENVEIYRTKLLKAARNISIKLGYQGFLQ